MTCRFQPVSSLARRTFWPPRPMAWASFSSSTAMSMVWFSSSLKIDFTSAGDIALMASCAGSSSHNTTSIFSPANSPDTACTREPRIPTQAPTASMRPSLVLTAIFAREPGSRAAARISMTSSAISGTSILNSSTSTLGVVRVRMSCGPRASGRISCSSARTRSPTRKVSRGMRFSRVRMASALLPRSTITLSREVFLMVPLTSWPTRDSYSSMTWLRSASRTFCTITCFAVCAAMRPNSTDSTGTW